MKDFQSFDMVDAHMHINTTDPAWLKKAQDDNVRIITINTYSSLLKQRDNALFQKNAFPEQIDYITSFMMKGWGEPEWQDNTLAYLKESFEMGAIAVKVWKDIGMSFKNKEGEFVMLDDPGFDPVFDFIEKSGKPLVGHIGEPKNCWLPLDEMTVNSDQAYFKMHPEFHMYLHPEYPSHEQIMKARDNMLANHSGLNFIGCHLGSLEWDVDELAKRFDLYPNFAVDMAERICHFQVQSQKDRDKVRDFIIKYADRLLYGSDYGSGLSTGKGDSVEEAVERMHNLWAEAWRYFATGEVMTAPEFEGEFKGLRLPKNVIEKIFRDNAEKWYPELTRSKKL
jgi:predicted TIM-barrel fold metal-dependent hydrolase